MSQPSSRPRLTGRLSGQLLAVFIVLLGSALFLISSFTTIALRTFLTSETDKTLFSSGQIIASETVDALIQGTSSTIIPSDFYFYIEDNFGATIEEVHPAVEKRFGKPANPEELTSLPINEAHSVAGTSQASKWRVINVPLKAAQPYPKVVGHVVIGLPLAHVERTVSNLKEVLTFFVIALICVGTLLSGVLVHRSLRSLRMINHVSSEVIQGNFAARVPPLKPGTEAAVLGDSINAMLTEIEQLFASQAASEQRMRRFVSDASHELRTPLATIRGYAELYRIGGVPADEVGNAIGRIESEANRMSNLVEDLLKLARLDERGEQKNKPVDLAATALNTVTDFLARAPQRQANVTNLSGDDVESVVVMGNPDAITQLLTNLLGNVHSHTAVTVPVEVAVGVNPEDPEHAIIEVRDHGPGIPQADREHVFERFYKANSSRARSEGEGSGLGLAIVAAIMEHHHGTAQARETPGGGLTVRLTFPLPPKHVGKN